MAFQARGLAHPFQMRGKGVISISSPVFGADNPAPSLPESAVAESTSWQAPADNDGLEPFPTVIFPFASREML